MQIQKDMNWHFVLLVISVLQISFMWGFESDIDRPSTDEFLLEQRVQMLRGNDGSWRIPDSVSGPTASADRQGLKDSPLTIHDVSGVRLGEVYQLRSSDKYVGLLLVVNKVGKARGMASGFSDVEWPLDRVSREVTLNDLNNSLFEPRFYLILDEDRLLLRVNLGKKELELNEIYLDAGEIGRGKGRTPTRASER
jgi:hypothetical protein